MPDGSLERKGNSENRNAIWKTYTVTGSRFRNLQGEKTVSTVASAVRYMSESRFCNIKVVDEFRGGTNASD